MTIAKTRIALVAALTIGLPLGVNAQAVPNLQLHADALQQQAERYPPSSFRITDGIDPIVAERTPSVVSQRGPGGQAPALAVWNDRVAVQPGEPLVLHARIDWLNSETAVWDQLSAAGSDWSVAGIVANQAGDTIATVAYNDAATGADVLAGDGIYTATVTLPNSAAPQAGQADSLIIKVTAISGNGVTRKAAGGVIFSNPAARLTGETEQLVRDGNLIVRAKAIATAPGRVHLAGTLSSLLGAPLASAQSAVVLERGEHWLELPFYGLILRDAGAAGALKLSSMTLRSTNGMPNALGPVLQDAAVLQPVPLTALTAVAHDRR